MFDFCRFISLFWRFELIQRYEYYEMIYGHFLAKSANYLKQSLISFQVHAHLEVGLP